MHNLLHLFVMDAGPPVRM